MKPVEEVESQSSECPSTKGKINIWDCQQCGKSIICIHADTGVTPFMIRCSKCGGEARSRFYRVDQTLKTAEFEWYRPRTVEEIIELTKAELKEYESDMPLDSAVNCQIEHYNNGGLFMRAVKQIQKQSDEQQRKIQQAKERPTAYVPELQKDHRQNRNDLCSCGSGLKAKFCCLRTQAVKEQISVILDRRKAGKGK